MRNATLRVNPAPDATVSLLASGFGLLVAGPGVRATNDTVVAGKTELAARHPKNQRRDRRVYVVRRPDFDRPESADIIYRRARAKSMMGYSWCCCCI